MSGRITDVAALTSTMMIEQSVAADPADMVVLEPETPSAVVRFRIPPATPPNADSASFHVHPVPAASVVDPRLSPNAAHPHDPVWVMDNVIVLDCATLCAPVNDASAPVNTSTRRAFAVKLPVRVLDTVIELPAEIAHQLARESRPVTPTVLSCVHVRLPPDIANVLDSSAREKAISRAPLGGVKLAVVAGFDVPLTNAGELASSATATGYSGLTPAVSDPMSLNDSNPMSLSAAVPNVPVSAVISKETRSESARSTIM
jgi:hypothetical protein